MSTSTRSDSQAQGLGPMVNGVAQDLGTLLHDQIALAKTEVRESARTVASSSILLIVAAFMALLGLIFLLVTIAYVLVTLGLAVWAGFGIVTLVLVILAAGFALLGVKRIKSLHGPERSLRQLQHAPELLPGHSIDA